MKEFDETEYYKDQIIPLVNELFKKLKMHNLPAYFSVCIANNGKKSFYETELLSPDIADRFLTEDRFPKYVDINLGFNTVPDKTMNIDCELLKPSNDDLLTLMEDGETEVS